MLWNSHRQPSGPTLAEITPTIPDGPSPAFDEQSPVFEEPTAIQEDTFVIPSSPSVIPSEPSVIPSEAKESVSSPVAPSDTLASPQAPRQEPQNAPRQDTRPDPVDPFLTLTEQIQRQRPRIIRYGYPKVPQASFMLQSHERCLRHLLIVETTYIP